MRTVYPIQIKNQLQELSKLQLSVDGFFLNNHLPDELASEMMLIAEELLVNIINYAYNDETEHTIKIELSVKEDVFSITFVDDGMPFNPLLQQPPTLGLPSEEVAIGGLGIPLMISLSDQQHYQYKGGYNIFSFSKIIQTKK